MELLEQEYTLTNSCLYHFYELKDKKDMTLLFLILKNANDIFIHYIDTLNDNNIYELIKLGFIIDSEVLDCYMRTHSKSYGWSFSFETFNILVKNSNLKNQLAPYKKFLSSLIYKKDFKMLQRFDFLKIDINEVLSNKGFTRDNEYLDEFIMKKLDYNIFILLVDNGFKLGSSFFSYFLDENFSKERVKFYVTQVEQSSVLDTDIKNIYYKKAIKTASLLSSDYTTIFELLNQLETLEVFEYGIELLLERKDIVFLLNKFEDGYIPSKNIIRKILRIKHGNYILNIIEKRYPEIYNEILPHIF